MSDSHNVGRRQLAEERWNEAAETFRGCLQDNPDDAVALAGLSRCLLAEGELDTAELEALRAVELDASCADGWIAVAEVALADDRLRAAGSAAQRALLHAPGSADALAVSALVQERLHRWPEALALAEHGLAFDAGHRICARVRARGLVRGGRTAEARGYIRQTLSAVPDDPLVKTEKGWSALDVGQADEAVRAFVEVLRADPDESWARQGLGEALPPLFPFYRPMLRWLLARQRAAESGHGTNAATEVLMSRLLTRTAERYARLRGIITTFLTLRALHAYVAWVARPVTNLLLCIHPQARPALPREEVAEGALAGLALGAILASLLAMPLWKLGPALVGFIVSMSMLSVLASVYSSPRGWPRQLVGAMALGLLGLGLFAFVKLAIWLPDWTGWSAFRFFLGGTVVVDVTGLLLSRVQPTRSRRRRRAQS